MWGKRCASAVNTCTSCCTSCSTPTEKLKGVVDWTRLLNLKVNLLHTDFNAVKTDFIATYQQHNNFFLNALCLRESWECVCAPFIGAVQPEPVDWSTNSNQAYTSQCRVVIRPMRATAVDNTDGMVESKSGWRLFFCPHFICHNIGKKTLLLNLIYLLISSHPSLLSLLSFLSQQSHHHSLLPRCVIDLLAQ